MKYYSILGRKARNGLLEIDFRDNNAIALEILLNIAYLRFKKIPNKLEYRQLLALSILTDKYQATPLIIP